RLAFWDEVSSIAGFPTGPKAFHLHPGGLVGNFIGGGGDCECAQEISEAQLQQIAPLVSKSVILHYLPHVNNSFVEYKVINCLDKAHFLAQMLHESGGFQFVLELGESFSYDPWRGRGLIQLSLEDNYVAYQNYSGVDVTSSLSAMRKLEMVPHSVLSAMWYWVFSRKLQEAAICDDFIWITYRVNGGFNHYDDRLKYLNRALDALRAMDCAKNNMKGSYLFKNSRAFHDKKASLAWGVWNDPMFTSGSKKFPGKERNAIDSLQGYQRFIELLGKEKSKKGWYRFEDPKQHALDRIVELKNRKSDD
ncbi:putative chitinase, partial [Chitinivorax tropicus]|nr:putative chitinase [Chitinivorax tropicus]